MRDPALSTASFPAARCEACDKTVLTYVLLEESGEERRLCVHCNGVVSPPLVWISAEELESWGYYFGSQPPRAAGACGTGCGSCASGSRH